jgi:hypothetical protein
LLLNDQGGSAVIQANDPLGRGSIATWAHELGG